MDLKPNVNSDPRRALPSVDKVSQELLEMGLNYPSWVVGLASQRAIDSIRIELTDVPGGHSLPDAEVVRDLCLQRAVALAERLAGASPRRVINATGVVLHTNLGRAPMASGAAEAAARAAMGYTDLELDLEGGRRGDRLGNVAEKLRLLSGAEDAYACNNNAAAVLLALNTLAVGQEVVVSRGELVEIGGSFRVPEIMRRAGVKLVEVGATNRTHASDYESAIGPDTAMLLKVHRSNFHQTGFVKEVSLAELVQIGTAHGLPVVEDLGSGTLLDLTQLGLPQESFVPGRLRDGPDLVCFSGDKLLGGPQAGIVLGKKETVAAMKRNPIARALRLDKMTLAALDWTLGRMLDGSAQQEIPVLHQLLLSGEAHEARTRKFCQEIDVATRGPGTRVLLEVMEDRVPVGGGSLPGFELSSWSVSVRSDYSAEELANRLRGVEVPILARIRDGRVVIDLRTVGVDEEAQLVAGLLQSII